MLLGVGKCGVDGLGEVVIVDGVVAATDAVAGTMLVTLLLGDVIVVVTTVGVMIEETGEEHFNGVLLSTSGLLASILSFLFLAFSSTMFITGAWCPVEGGEIFCGCGDTLATGLLAGGDTGKGVTLAICLFCCSDGVAGDSPTCTLASLLLVGIK